eukprot:CAMPEP_0202728930 /NCGR_PEP_ID=MMETSP1385-20130828/185872_1 /ASSEMBLY_ACC=CAM_ASM_000861 /TAXON_ID=933848 /ORGANISM="Elphidium margaritaceum" /LENGTH=4770 /DNA_ID=CAMNT_0049395183 /DNA_START=131 /DNA_END=14440 /DNA_ORIENTATION=-
MSTPRTKWMQEVIQNVLDIDSTTISECFESHADNISLWLKSGSNESRVYFYETETDKGIEYSTESPAISRSCVYFLRNSAKAINLKTRSDNTVLTGNISKSALIPVLKSCITDVYEPIITKTNEWNKISDGKGEKLKFIKQGKRFSELLTTSMNNLDHGISIELPSKPELQNIDPDDNFDTLIEDDISMTLVRDTVKTWIGSIHKFISDDQTYILHRSEEINSGPKQEINFWCKRNLVLNKTQQLLDTSAFRGILSVLQTDAEEEAERNGTSLITDPMLATPNTRGVDENDAEQISNDAELSSPQGPQSPSKRRLMSSPKLGSMRKLRSRTGTSGYGSPSNDRKSRQKQGQKLTRADSEQNSSNMWKNPLPDTNTSSSIAIHNAFKKTAEQLNEALHEAEDNEKFLEKLRSFVQPMYNEENRISIISESLPLLFNNLKMIFTLSRYYSWKSRMTNLLTRVTHQMVSKCMDCIETQNGNHQATTMNGGGEAGETNGDDGETRNVLKKTSLWDQDIEILIDSMRKCIAMKNEYKAEYHATCKKLEEIPKGKQWTFDVSIIFVKFEKFCRRLEKLIDMFSSIQQFKLLESQHIDGLKHIIVNFNKLVAEFRKKQHHLLNDTDTAFERDYVEFTMNNSILENKIEVYIENEFKLITAAAVSSSSSNDDSGARTGNEAGIAGEDGAALNVSTTTATAVSDMANDGHGHGGGDISSIITSLELLNKFKLILHREALQNILDAKYILLFKSYGRSLEAIQDAFIKKRVAPTIGKNMTKVAGNISWSRQLLRRITIPMNKFRENPRVFHPKESHKIIKKYNALTKKLIHYEIEYYNAWKQCCNIGKKKLQTPLIIEHGKTGEFYANFDRHIFELIRETKFLQRMGFQIPASAKIVLLLEDNFKEYFAKIKNITEMYNHMIKCTSPIIKTIVTPHFECLKKIMRPGLNELTWNSMNISKYIEESQAAIQRLYTLICHINDILENRIRANLPTIANMCLLHLPANKSFTCKSFIHEQQKAIVKASNLLKEKNIEIYNAITDLIEQVQNFPIPAQFASNIDSVPTVEFNKVIYYYQTLMYQSIFGCIKTSLTALQERASSRTLNLFSSNDEAVAATLFEVNLCLVVPNIQVKPSLNEIQDAINEIANKLIHTTEHILDWGVNEQGETCEQVPFFQRLSADNNVAAVLTMLTGAVEDTKEFVTSHLQKYKQFEWLWLKEPEDEYKQFIQQQRILQDFVDELQKVANVEQQIEKLNELESLACFNLSTKNLKYQLKHECQRWKLQFCEKLHNEVKQDLEARIALIKNFNTRLNREIKDFTSLKFVIDALTEIRDTQSWISMDFLSIFNRYELLEKYLGSEFLSNIETDNKSMLRVLWKRLLVTAEEVRDKVNELQEPFQHTLVQNIATFQKDVAEFDASYKQEGPFACDIQKPAEAMVALNKFEREFDTLYRKYELYSSGETLFGLEKTKYERIKTMKEELVLMRQLYNVYGSVMDTMDEYRNISWTEVMSSIEKMRGSAELYENKCKKLNKSIKKWDQYKQLNTTISNFLEILPLIEAMSKPSMRPRHWEEISGITGTHYDYTNFDELSLSQILDSNILEFVEDIEEICEGADKQLRIENDIKNIKESWDKERFEFAAFKSRGEVILRGNVVNDVIEKLEESMANLNQMLTMKHVKPFREDAESLLSTLSDVNDILERWIKLQQLWMSLESVFTSGDIARQMPTDTRTFLKVDKEWCSRFITKAKELSGVIACCQNEYMKNILPSMMVDLERCQKALDGYLEAKRNTFPRFYFVSNPALLLILSQGSDKVAVQSCFTKVFDSITRVDFDDKNNIVAFKSLDAGYEGTTDEERLKLSRPVSTNGNIEDWLGSLEKEMRRTMHREIKTAAYDTLIENMDLATMIDKHCAQCSLLAIQFLWTAQVEDALNAACNHNDKEAMKLVQQKQNDVLVLLASMTTEEIGKKMKRRNIETLVTIQVHQKDVLDAMVEKYKKHQLVGGIDDFEWQKQLRCYWSDEERVCRVQIADVSFVYCWEYLGCKERLVVTPLTDRCYITLTQACGMFFGGAPAGPAGTGKTETVKDLGRALGKYVVVFNCSDQMRYTDTAKIYKGLCQSGSWGCFDEFNRIDLEVLSVVAQQIMAILSAMRSRSKEFYFPGDLNNKVTLDARCGFFITMNPGYAGRQELPENLKALFRSVAMMVPDSGIIIKVKLASVGYLSFDILAKKFNVLYGLCKEQLSKQRHYDFGLRNILSVLRTAGANLRVELKKGTAGSRSRLEEMLMMRTLRDMNLSKLVGDDVGLFNSLLRDLFPNQPDPEKAQYVEVQEALASVIAKNKLVLHASWMAKIVQLYETSLVRHGLMMIGPAGSGKTKAIWCLIEALQQVKKKKHVEIRMNPKALKADEMFGENDTVSGEWTDGVFSSIWSKYNDNTKNQCTWIVCDGPVDAIWIENLNTVLDDNKLLTLANGDRIPMTDNVKILFEAEDLRNASPATVSRAGIIFVSEDDLGNQPLVQAWLQQRREKEKKILAELWDRFVVQPDVFEWLKKNTHSVFPSTPKHLSVNLLSLMEALLKYSVQHQIFYSELVYEKIFIYCAAWSLGGLFERADQIRFHEKLFSISSIDWSEYSRASDGDDKATIYEFYVDLGDTTKEPQPNFEPNWLEWKAPTWQFPSVFKFSECLIPTRDSVRAEYLLRTMCTDNNYPTLVLGSSGTGKTSTIFQFFSNLSDGVLQKSINFSSATTCGMFQANIEADIEKRQGKTFAPPFGRRMIVFLDDISMPEVNAWGDQPTLEIVRQLIEYHGFYFLEKDKRGYQKTIELLDYVAAMSHPGGGRNDIPNRLKRHFYAFNITPPSNVSIDNIYGQMLRGRYASATELSDVIPTITRSTIKLWLKVKSKMLPTPSKFHYIFNLFDLSRVFQGVLLPPVDVIDSSTKLVDLWIHECERVFCDKLVSLQDQTWYKQTMQELIREEFGDGVAETHNSRFVYWADFFREDIIDAETEEIAEFAPKIYEAAPSFEACKSRVESFLQKYNHEPKMKEMPLVLFTDAVKHLMRICRILAMPRGNLLFVGVGGSGRQSLTKLATYICRYELCQIQLTRNYKTADLLEDIKQMCILCGKEGKKVTFLVSDSDIVHEDFLEYINMMLATGMIAGLFAKEERDMMAAEIRPIAKKELTDFDDTHEQLVKFLMNRIRENFHIVLAFSPANQKFAERARKFPALISGCTIDWFLRWPVDALMSVSTQFIADDTSFELECRDGDQEKQALIQYIGRVHDIIVNCCEEYFVQYRRHVYVTPKSYLSFINMYKQLYTAKRAEIDRKARNVHLGLSKIAKASEDVNNMKAVLAVQKEELKVAERNTQDMLAKLEVGAKEAEIQKQQAQNIEVECQETANVINKEKEEANAELQAALPFMEQAKKAAKSLNKKDIGFVAALPKPHDLIKRIMDCVSILLIKPLIRVENAQIVVNKEPHQFIKDSYSEFSLKMMSSAQFIPDLLSFSVAKKDEINEETMELLEPYLNVADFEPDSAKKIAAAAAGLCNFVKAMYQYHKASLIVAPKLAALQIKEGELSDAMDKLKEAQKTSAAAQAKVDELQRNFSATMAEKKRIEDTAKLTQNKMIAATNLIGSLGGERDRWTEDAKSFKDEKIKLVGDAAMACAFVSYCGPFNQQYRRKIVSEYFYPECVRLGISVTDALDVNQFLCDDSTIAEWNSQTLPKDELSVQNGILVTSATRWPLIIDPQGQAAQWLKHRCAPRFPYFGTTSISEPRLRDQLKYAMQEGKVLLVEGVEEELDPMLDPVLEKNLFKQGKTFYVKLGDEDAEYDEKFEMYFITKLSNPHFTPELSAKTTVVDFAVTQKGLEDQLLSVVINQEQKSLEEQRVKLIEEVNHNTISLLNLDKQLLQKLSETEGDLLEDIELINVLNETKKSAQEVKTKIESSKQTEAMINKKREQYRSVARRGSILYFVMVDMALVNWMYQTSLAQFLTWFDYALRHSKAANLVNQRVANIIEYMTYHIYDNVNRGLFGDDQLTFKIMCSLRICETESKLLSNAEIQTFLKCGSALSLDKIKVKKPFDWINVAMWTNIMALAQSIEFFRDLPTLIANNEKLWRVYYEDEQPENLDIPILQERIAQLVSTGNQGKAAFYKMLLIRAMRDDRMTLVSKEFISAIMGEQYVQPSTYTMEEVYGSTPDAATPIILMLTPGADPTQTLKDLARNKGVGINIVSMGEGQEPHATKAITDGMSKGDWALLQNCHLGLKYMSNIPENLKKWQEELGGKIEPTFRLWITCEAHPSFPIALLQMSVKVTQEAPQGLKAGLLRSYTTLVNKDRLQRVDKQEWRDLVFCLCFLHSVVQERRKFGPLGWNIPYEFNESDLDASLMFLEKHMFTSADISWSTVQYMICEAQYGGRITDDFDRVLFNTYGKSWLGKQCFDGDRFQFCTLPHGAFTYKIPATKALVEQYQDYIQTFPANDSPEIFGLHTNADLTYGSATTQRILNTILDTQPKESASSSGKTREETVKEICTELLQKMPKDYVEEDVRDRIKKRPKAELEYVLQEKNPNVLKNVNGFEIPLNVFLYQEIVRLQRAIQNVRSTLSDLILAIDGVVIMTPNLQLALNSIFDAKPPPFWYMDASGAQIAWTSPTLSLWFEGLLKREEQLTSWLTGGRPNVYWMTGFFNPQGFLTAMKQEVTRRHKHDRWALDDVILKTTILDEYDFKKIRGPTDDGGVYVHGLFLDGCSWDAKAKVLSESKPKELYTKLPIIHVTAITNKMAETERTKSKFKLYQCPVYTVPKRT